MGFEAGKKITLTSEN